MQPFLEGQIPGQLANEGITLVLGLVYTMNHEVGPWKMASNGPSS